MDRWIVLYFFQQLNHIIDRPTSTYLAFSQSMSTKSRNIVDADAEIYSNN